MKHRGRRLLFKAKEKVLASGPECFIREWYMFSKKSLVTQTARDNYTAVDNILTKW